MSQAVHTTSLVLKSSPLQALCSLACLCNSCSEGGPNEDKQDPRKDYLSWPISEGQAYLPGSPKKVPQKGSPQRLRSPASPSDSWSEGGFLEDKQDPMKDYLNWMAWI